MKRNHARDLAGADAASRPPFTTHKSYSAMTITETAIMDENGNRIGTKYRAGYEVENLDENGEPEGDALEPAFVMGETDADAKRPEEFDGLSKDSDGIEIPDWSPLDELESDG